VLTTAPSDPPDIIDAEVELGFRFDQLLALSPNVQVNNTLMAEHLAHAIAAAPTNLLCHTQRIFFFFGNGDHDGLYSALLDMFIAMDGKGKALRKRLLMGSRERLMPEHYNFLYRWLEQGQLREDKDILPAGQSILNKGITGVRKLVQVFYAESKAQRDPLLEAREYIEYFQIDEARELLENAIIAQPEREELHLELIHLYQATRDVAGMQTMRENLSQIMPLLPECWLKLGDSLSPQGGKNP
jgi:hypothetical protein